VRFKLRECALNYTKHLHADLHAHFKHPEIQHVRARSAAVLLVQHRLKVSALTYDTQHICT
jgi:hypothetical protein